MDKCIKFTILKLLDTFANAAFLKVFAILFSYIILTQLPEVLLHRPLDQSLVFLVTFASANFAVVIAPSATVFSVFAPFNWIT